MCSELSVYGKFLNLGEFGDDGCTGLLVSRDDFVYIINFQFFMHSSVAIFLNLELSKLHVP